jgi:hypothetical protein
MNRPALLARLAGSPRGALVLFVCYAALVFGWYQGNIPWWLALGAVGAAFRTLSAVGRVRRYKAWRADWQAMGGEDEPPPAAARQKKRRRGWVLVTVAALLALGMPLLPEQLYAPWESGLVMAWCAACLYLVFALLWSILRRIIGRRKARAEIAQAGDEAAPVAWLLGRPSSSPSRAAAERNLPRYCARLISGIH